MLGAERWPQNNRPRQAQGGGHSQTRPGQEEREFLHHIVSCHVMLCHVVSCHVVP
jgi:hypothetical protein